MVGLTPPSLHEQDQKPSIQAILGGLRSHKGTPERRSRIVASVPFEDTAFTHQAASSGVRSESMVESLSRFTRAIPGLGCSGAGKMPAFTPR